MRKTTYTLAAGVIATLLFNGIADAQNINVVINGQTLNFSGTQPQEMNNSVLVPLRGVFEELGANVQYNPTTKTIFAVKGSTNVSLALGSTTAYVNGQTQQLLQPPTVILGTTLVPLRFVAESFGAYVEWQPQTSTVQIQTGPSEAQAPAPPSAPPPPAYYRVPPQQGYPTGDDHNDLQKVKGFVTQIQGGNGPTTISVNTNAGPVQINVDDRTNIIIKSSDGTTTPATVQQIHSGDVISARIRPDGDGRFVELDFNEYKGRLAAVQGLPNGALIAIFDNGHVATIDADAFEYRNNQPTQLHLHQGEEVSLRTHPNGQRVYSVDVF